MSRVAEDTVFDDRYRIVNRIGSGGMADVYRAEDTHLGRDIALKVLHRRFAQDNEFVERFRREARAAAGLSHPNIVGIYDRGEHEGTYYIAMEHLRGRTLKDVIESEAPLDQHRAIDFGIQILRGAGFAHRHGVIHRDLKPHNVIVDAEGATKVTDFGIARAGASEMTETGSIMGTAQYLSPEQAQGQPVTATSDVYSIGIILYEMLTGRLPFTGDSAVSIALKHLSDSPPPMAEAGVEIEPNLEQVVMGALAKDPEARWETAEDFADALEACKPYVDAHAAGERTAAPPAVAAAAVADPSPAAEAAEPEDKSGRRRKILWAVLGALTIALVALMAWVFSRPEEASIPKVTGMSLSDARVRLDRAGFDSVRVQRERSEADYDAVLRQDPDPGESAPKDEPVVLAVSGGPGKVRIPAVENLPQKRAVRELDRAGLRVRTDAQDSNEVPSGRAISTSPRAGTEVDRDSRVTLFVSSGPEQVTVPDVTGLTREAAETKLTSENLEVTVSEREDDEAEEGEVLGQTPGASTAVAPGTTVRIVVATQPEQSTVPDVSGLSARDAARVLSGEGLSAVTRERATANESEDGVVIEQRPSAGGDVDRGSQVLIFIGRFEDPEEDLPTETTPEAAP